MKTNLVARYKIDGGQFLLEVPLDVSGITALAESARRADAMADAVLDLLRALGAAPKRHGGDPVDARGIAGGPLAPQTLERLAELAELRATRPWKAVREARLEPEGTAAADDPASEPEGVDPEADTPAADETAGADAPETPDPVPLPTDLPAEALPRFAAEPMITVMAWCVVDRNHGERVSLGLSAREAHDLAAALNRYEAEKGEPLDGEEIAEIVDRPVPPVTGSPDDPFDIPSFMRREPRPAATQETHDGR